MLKTLMSTLNLSDLEFKYSFSFSFFLIFSTFIVFYI